jgi:predicted amidophosphoribosyltransferase
MKSAKKLKALFLDLVFPIECLSCGRGGAWLCPSCFSKIKSKESQFCLSCKQKSRFGRFCRNCYPDYNLRGVLIAADYDNELVAKLIKNLKYRFVGDLSKDLGRFLILFLLDLFPLLARLRASGFRDQPLVADLETCSRPPLVNIPRIFSNFSKALIVPIPLHPRRKRWRGFNQAELIARRLADYFGAEISVDELLRIKYTKPQTKLSEEKRRSNIKNCFAWRAGGLAGRNIILVDDVATTGSTLNEAARVLKENGAGEIWGLVVAKG